MCQFNIQVKKKKKKPPIRSHLTLYSSPLHWQTYVCTYKSVTIQLIRMRVPVVQVKRTNWAPFLASSSTSHLPLPVLLSPQTHKRKTQHKRLTIFFSSPALAPRCSLKKHKVTRHRQTPSNPSIHAHAHTRTHTTSCGRRVLFCSVIYACAQNADKAFIVFSPPDNDSRTNDWDERSEQLRNGMFLVFNKYFFSLGECEEQREGKREIKSSVQHWTRKKL